MMDFEDAAQRLARDQKKIRGRSAVVVSQKAKKQAEYQRKQQEKLRLQRERQRRQLQYQQSYMKGCDRSVHVKSIGTNGSNLQLQPTSIYGEGDKISLPPSVLETLTSSTAAENNVGNPWTFRIGILNPNYSFPASPLIQALQPPPQDDESTSNNDMDIDDYYDDESDDDDSHNNNKAAYLDELSYKYLAYVHCTVVEFTQEEGHVGIPQPIATALLKQANSSSTTESVNEKLNNSIPITRTVDPAAQGLSSNVTEDDDNENNVGNDMQENHNNDVDDQTPGHLAWGAFDIPNVKLEITKVKLPKGRGCTLVPTREAVENNFYGLKDVKLVLEQSLIRSRATLSVGDVVATWHRGVKFDLNVTKVIPSLYNSVTCINTDIEVDIGEVPTDDEGNKNTAANYNDSNNKDSTAMETNSSSDSPVSGGYKLGTSSGATTTTTTSPPSDSKQQVIPSATTTSTKDISLPPEPPEDVTDGICNVQIRYSGGNGKRRFDISKTNIKQLFSFASSLINNNRKEFRLVTRFPRRVITTDQSSMTLHEVGIQEGQELFMVEFI